MREASFVAIAALAVIFLSWRRDGTVAASSVEKGTALADLVVTAGEPSLRRNVFSSDPTDLCAGDSRNVKAVHYHAFYGPARVFGLVGAPPSYVVEVCLDSNDRVTATHSYHNN